MTARIVLLILTLSADPAFGHEVRPGYLELRETGPDVYEMLWKVPALGGSPLAIRLRLPVNCVASDAPVRFLTEDASVERAILSCPGGIAGRQLSVEGLVATVTDVLTRVVRADGSTQVARLTPGHPVVVVAATPSRLDVAWTYLQLGVEHILLGVDHLLFVLGLLIIVGPTRRLVATVTAFTVAHSATLAAATLGFVHVPPKPVEAVIALSIVFVAAEIVHGHEGHPGLTERQPWVVAFVFGLLHGFGFAGALAEVGLPTQAIPLALFFFNVGVEVGQLLFIAAVLAAIALLRRARVPWPSWAWRVPAYGIGVVAAYWTIDRVAGF